MPQLFFRPKYVWFPVNLWGPVIPDPSGQLAELIIYHIEVETKWTPDRRRHFKVHFLE